MTMTDLQGTMSLNKALKWCGVSRKMWYHTPTERRLRADTSLDAEVQKISTERPSYDTRRMAAQLSRITGAKVNRKRIKIFLRLNLVSPRLKFQIIRSQKNRG